MAAGVAMCLALRLRIWFRQVCSLRLGVCSLGIVHGALFLELYSSHATNWSKNQILIYSPCL